MLGVRRCGMGCDVEGEGRARRGRQRVGTAYRFVIIHTVQPRTTTRYVPKATHDSLPSVGTAVALARTTETSITAISNPVIAPKNNRSVRQSAAQLGSVLGAQPVVLVRDAQAGARTAGGCHADRGDAEHTRAVTSTISVRYDPRLPHPSAAPEASELGHDALRQSQTPTR